MLTLLILLEPTGIGYNNFNLNNRFNFLDKF